MNFLSFVWLPVGFLDGVGGNSASGHHRYLQCIGISRLGHSAVVARKQPTALLRTIMMLIRKLLMRALTDAYSTTREKLYTLLGATLSYGPNFT